MGRLPCRFGATSGGDLHDACAAVDTGVAYSDGSVSGSIARAGSFRAAALIVSPGTDPVLLQGALRDIGIFIHGALVVPATAEAQAPAETQ